MFTGLPEQYGEPDERGVQWYEDDKWIAFQLNGFRLNRMKHWGDTRESMQERAAQLQREAAQVIQ